MIEQIIAGVLKLHCDIIATRVKSRWSTMSAIKGQESIHSTLPVIIGNLVSASIEAQGMSAWIKEYGSGSLVDTKSPYWQEYTQSPMYNKERATEGNEFIARSAGSTVYRPDGTTYSSTGNAYRRVYKMNKAGQHGLHLERPLNRTGNYPGYKAFLGSHIIEHEVSAELPEIIAHLQQVIEAEVLAELTMDVQIYI